MFQVNDYNFLLDFVSNNGKRDRDVTPDYGITYKENLFNSKWKSIHEVFFPITDEDISCLENKMAMPIHPDYKWFLQNISNGLHLYMTTLCLDGKRTHYDRSKYDPQPFDIITKNTLERPKNAKSNMLFIGGYDWDGSCLYVDNNDGSVHLCEEWDVTSLKRWDSFHSMLLDEVTRLKNLYGICGENYSDDIYSLPV